MDGKIQERAVINSINKEVANFFSEMLMEGEELCADNSEEEEDHWKCGSKEKMLKNYKFWVWNDGEALEMHFIVSVTLQSPHW